MVASGSEKSVVHLSLRFTLTHMTGSFSANVLNGIRSVLDSSSDGGELRKRQGGVGPGGAGGGGAGLAMEHALAGDDSHFNIPYQLQTGPTRYAPMAERPGTAITAKTASRQYPATPYHIATTYLPKPTVSVTISAPVTYSVHSIENPVCIRLPPAIRMLISVSAIGSSRTTTRCQNETVLGKVEGLICALCLVAVNYLQRLDGPLFGLVLCCGAA